jgi:hydroxypyruvate isomerase
MPAGSPRHGQRTAPGAIDAIGDRPPDLYRIERPRACREDARRLEDADLFLGQPARSRFAGSAAGALQRERDPGGGPAMPRFAANISTMFTDRPFAERIAAAAAAGFGAVECQFPYEASAAELETRLDRAGVDLVLLNTPPGDFAAGERGLAGLPGREAEFRAGIERALEYASRLGCPQIHVMAGVRPDGADRKACLAVYKANLRVAAENCARAGKVAVIEPINSRDIPGYLLNTPTEAAAMIEEVGAHGLRLQFDFYHVQIMAGDLARSFERHLPVIGHVQIAGVPERHEPDVGEINYPYLFDLMDRLGYAGWVGCEYFPAGGTEEGLGWAYRYGIAPRSTTLATGGERV